MTESQHEMTLHRELSRGITMFSRGDFAEAEALFGELAAEYPERPDVLALLGHLALLSKRADKAIEHLASALRINSRALSTWNLLADAYYRKGEFGSATYCYDRIKRRELAATLAAMADLIPYRLEGVTDSVQTGHGGGGELQGTPMQSDRVCLGSVCRESVTGMLLEDFSLELRFGFRIGGLLGHDFFQNRTIALDFGSMSLDVF